MFAFSKVRKKDIFSFPFENASFIFMTTLTRFKFFLTPYFKKKCNFQICIEIWSVTQAQPSIAPNTLNFEEKKGLIQDFSTTSPGKLFILRRSRLVCCDFSPEKETRGRLLRLVDKHSAQKSIEIRTGKDEQTINN